MIYNLVLTKKLPICLLLFFVHLHNVIKIVYLNMENIEKSIKNYLQNPAIQRKRGQKFWGLCLHIFKIIHVHFKIPTSSKSEIKSKFTSLLS